MTQNLRIIGPKIITSDDSDVITSYNITKSDLNNFSNSYLPREGSYLSPDYPNVYGAYYTYHTATVKG